MGQFCSSVRIVSYELIKKFTFFLCIFLLVDLGYSLKQFVSAIEIRSHLGYFINLVSNGDGDILPTLQAIPVLLFLLLNLGMAVLLYLAFDSSKKPIINKIMFVITIIDLIFIICLYGVIIAIIAHSYHEHKSLHNGITEAMGKYSSNVKIKQQIDRMQIEFRCCGSKKYEEWYSLVWYDAALVKGTIKENDGNTPFSCCSIESLFPCIHHNIENTGKNYLYAPEFNLSISTNGCYHALRKKKQSVGWWINLNLFVFSIFQILTLILFRFIQTAHYENYMFLGRKVKYKIWLFICPKQCVMPKKLKSISSKKSEASSKK